MKKTICLDFDGVIHNYTSGWHGHSIIKDGAVEGSMEAIREYLKDFKVYIFSTRADKSEGVEAIKRFLLYNGLDSSEIDKITITAGPKPKAVMYIDDRGFTFKGTFPTNGFIKNFKPWNKS